MFLSEFWMAILSNIVICSLIASIAIFVSRYSRRPALGYFLWILVLIKLVTPTIVEVPLIPATWVGAGNLVSSEQMRSLVVSRASPTRISQTNLTNTVAVTAAFPKEAGKVGTGKVETGKVKLAKPVPASVYPASQSENWIRLASTMVFVAWLIGSIVFCKRRIMQAISIRKLLAYAEENDESVIHHIAEISKRVRIKNPPSVSIIDAQIPPFAWATFTASRIVLPKKLLDDLDREELHTLLAHEVAHLHSNHHWGRWLETIVGAVYWWCPLYWLASQKLRESEELVCDAWVTQAMPEHSESYANCLLRTLAFISKNQTQPTVAAAMGANQFKQLSHRISCIMDQSLAPTLTHRSKSALALTLILIGPFSMALSYQTPLVSEIQPTAMTGAETLNGTQFKTSNSNIVFVIGPNGTRSVHVDRPAKENWIAYAQLSTSQGISFFKNRIESVILNFDKQIKEMVSEKQDQFDDLVGELNTDQLQSLSEFDYVAHFNQTTPYAPESISLFIEAVSPNKIAATNLERQSRRMRSRNISNNTPAINSQIRAVLENEFRELVQIHRSANEELRAEIQLGLVGCPEELAGSLRNSDFSGLIKQCLKDSHPITKKLNVEFGLEKQILHELETDNLKITNQLGELSNRFSRIIEENSYGDTEQVIKEATALNPQHPLAKDLIERQRAIRKFLANQ